MDELKIGRKIHQIRLQNKLTLLEVAQRTGFTKSYLSMIEQGKKSPPIATLSKIARGFGVDIGAFFEQRKPEDSIMLVKKGEREVVVRDGTIFGYRYEAIAPTKKRKKMEPFIITLPSKSKEGDLFDHEGEELFYVLEGQIRFFYGDKKYSLREGDCIYFDSSIPHRGEGVGNRPAKALVVIYSP
ncbi:MAG: cupin domain-containing protein [Deltaproteobacteria bacterium]|nr:cupin domain-containing protein [Deltaproteobacteria bacterium]